MPDEYYLSKKKMILYKLILRKMLHLLNHTADITLIFVVPSPTGREVSSANMTFK